MSTDEEGYLQKAICFFIYICQKGRILPPSLMSSGRGILKKVANLLKIDIVIGDAKLL